MDPSGGKPFHKLSQDNLLAHAQKKAVVASSSDDQQAERLFMEAESLLEISGKKEASGDFHMAMVMCNKAIGEYYYYKSNYLDFAALHEQHANSNSCYSIEINLLIRTDDNFDTKELFIFVCRRITARAWFKRRFTGNSGPCPYETQHDDHALT